MHYTTLKTAVYNRTRTTESFMAPLNTHLLRCTLYILHKRMKEGAADVDQCRHVARQVHEDVKGEVSRDDTQVCVRVLASMLRDIVEAPWHMGQEDLCALVKRAWEYSEQVDKAVPWPPVK